MEEWRSPNAMVAALPVPRPNACSECGGPLVHASGCVLCRLCGHSACE